VKALASSASSGVTSRGDDKIHRKRQHTYKSEPTAIKKNMTAIKTTEKELEESEFTALTGKGNSNIL